ncbi:MAG: hypothetical protein U1F77_14245 [Kiritimatiellia bacterium]
MMKHSPRNGQVMLEFAVMLVMSLGVIIILMLFFITFKEFGGRILDLVASEYP